MVEALDRIREENAVDELLTTQVRYMTAKEDYETCLASAVCHAEIEARERGWNEG